MIVGVPKESYPGERRVALVPGVIPNLKKKGFEVLIETGAGTEAGFPDREYAEKGATIVNSRAELFSSAEIVLQVRAAGANLESGGADLGFMRQGQHLIAFLDPLSEPQALHETAQRGVNTFSMELMPRITRAQSMDALSSMATIAGYKAVLIAADNLPRMFPMMMTAAGTISPARAFVIGAGVAGLQAIASAKRLGAVVRAYDVRPAVKEQIESLGAKFVEMELDAADSEDKGGYAKAMDESFYRKQRELMAHVLTESDVVIATAAVPGQKAPILLTGEMLKGMPSGSVIVDLAAERGGNCDVTQPGATIVHNGVTVVGPLNLPSTVPYHASQMYSKNITTFLLHLAKDGRLQLNQEDEITQGTLVTYQGEIIHPRVRDILGLGPLTTPEGSTN